MQSRTVCFSLLPSSASVFKNRPVLPEWQLTHDSQGHSGAEKGLSEAGRLERTDSIQENNNNTENSMLLTPLPYQIDIRKGPKNKRCIHELTYKPESVLLILWGCWKVYPHKHKSEFFPRSVQRGTKMAEAPPRDISNPAVPREQTLRLSNQQCCSQRPC